MIGEAGGIRRFLARQINVLPVDVANRPDMHFWAQLELAHDVTAAVSRSDHSQLECVVRSQNAGVGGRRQSGRAAHESAPAKILISHVRIISR